MDAWRPGFKMEDLKSSCRVIILCDKLWVATHVSLFIMLAWSTEPSAG
jgi:hypothetical protein